MIQKHISSDESDSDTEIVGKYILIVAEREELEIASGTEAATGELTPVTKVHMLIKIPSLSERSRVMNLI